MNIHTSRLTLHALTPQDAYLLYRYRSKKEVEKYQSFHDFTFLEAMQTVNMPAPKKEAGSYQLGIYLNDWLIGDLFFHFTKNLECFLGYTLDDDYWHHGYGYEAVKASIEYLKRELDISEYYAYIDQNNLASIKLIRKLGFVKLENGIYYLHIV